MDLFVLAKQKNKIIVDKFIDDFLQNKSQVLAITKDESINKEYVYKLFEYIKYILKNKYDFDDIRYEEDAHFIWNFDILNGYYCDSLILSFEEDLIYLNSLDDFHPSLLQHNKHILVTHKIIDFCYDYQSIELTKETVKCFNI